MTQMFKVDRVKASGESSCGGCNWENTICYVLAESQGEAEDMVKGGQAGLCGDCMCDMIQEEGWSVIMIKHAVEMK